MSVARSRAQNAGAAASDLHSQDHTSEMTECSFILKMKWSPSSQWRRSERFCHHRTVSKGIVCIGNSSIYCRMYLNEIYLFLNRNIEIPELSARNFSLVCLVSVLKSQTFVIVRSSTWNEQTEGGKICSSFSLWSFGSVASSKVWWSRTLGHGAYGGVKLSPHDRQEIVRGWAGTRHILQQHYPGDLLPTTKSHCLVTVSLTHWWSSGTSESSHRSTVSSAGDQASHHMNFWGCFIFTPQWGGMDHQYFRTLPKPLQHMLTVSFYVACFPMLPVWRCHGMWFCVL